MSQHVSKMHLDCESVKQFPYLYLNPNELITVLNPDKAAQFKCGEQNQFKDNIKKQSRVARNPLNNWGFEQHGFVSTERGGFEPPRGLLPHTNSNRAPSTAQPSLQMQIKMIGTTLGWASTLVVPTLKTKYNTQVDCIVISQPSLFERHRESLDTVLRFAHASCSCVTTCLPTGSRTDHAKPVANREINIAQIARLSPHRIVHRRG
jgi:hypothetical protein